MYPLIAVMQRLVGAGTLSTSDVLYIGRKTGVEERIAAGLALPFAGVQVRGVRGMAPATQLRNLAEMMGAQAAAAELIAQFRPDVVLATGGYVSAPVLWAAWRRHIPIIITLPDLEPGWAIQATWRLSRRVAVSFEEVLKYFPRGRATVTGYPVRAEFYQATRAQGHAHFQLDTDKPVVTVFGGSQGAHALNEAVRLNLVELLRASQVIHMTGKHDLVELQKARAQLHPALAERYYVYDYLDQDMPLALAAADLVVARAGAATLGEFPAVGVPSVLVPGQFAAGHQEANAAFLKAHGGAVVLQEELLPQILVPTLQELLADSERLDKMKAAVKQLDQPAAAERIGQLLREAAR